MCISLYSTIFLLSGDMIFAQITFSQPVFASTADKKFPLSHSFMFLDRVFFTKLLGTDGLRL